MSELYRDFIEDQFDRVVNAINNELPTPTTSDIGKVVQVVSDGGSGAEYALDAVPNELPTPTTSDIGKFATVVSDGSGGAEYSLDSVPQELPTPTASDIGKVVQVVSDGGAGAEYAVNSMHQLPDPTGEYNKLVLTNIQGTGYILSNSLFKPTIDSTDVGKILGVTTDGSGRIYVKPIDIPTEVTTSTVTINRSNNTATVTNYSTIRSELINTSNLGRLTGSFTVSSSDYMDNDNVSTIFTFRGSTIASHMEPPTYRPVITKYDIYETVFYAIGTMYRGIIKLDISTGSGTYTEYPIGGSSVASEITLDFSPWKYGGVQEAEVASKLGDAQNTNKETIATITAVGDTTVHFSGIRISTNTGSNEGYFNIEVNGTNVHKQSLNSDTWQQFTNIPDVQLTNGDVLTVNVGFDGTHTGCYFRVSALQP